MPNSIPPRTIRPPETKGQSTYTPTPDRPARKPGWTVRISPDVDLKPIRPSHFKMAAILERLWRTHPHAFPSNGTLADRYGCTGRQARSIIAEMERAGFVSRVSINPEKPHLGRAGILAHRRLDLDLPIADQPPSTSDLGRLAPEENFRPPRRKTSSGPPEENFLQKNDFVSLKDDVSKNDPDSTLPKRQRRGARPSRGGPGATQAAIGPALGFPAVLIAESLTAGQRAFLDGLTTIQRTTFDALPADRQAELLKPHALGLDLVIGADQAVKLTPRKVEMPKLMPTTTVELLSQLPGSSPAWCQAAAELLVQEFGNPRDRKLWGEFHRIAKATAAGELKADDLVNAYRQAMRPGIKNRGAKFWAAFKGLTGKE